MNTLENHSTTKNTLRSLFKQLGYRIDRSDFDQTAVTIQPLSSVFITGTVLLILGLLFIPSMSGVISYFFINSKGPDGEEISYFSVAISFAFGLFGIMAFAKGITRIIKHSKFKIEISDKEITIRQRVDILIRRTILKNPTGMFIHEEDGMIALVARSGQEEIKLLEEQSSEHVKLTYQTLIDRIDLH